MKKKLKKSILKYTRYNPKYKYRNRFPFHVTNAPYFFTNFNSAIQHMKSKRKMKFKINGKYPVATMLKKVRNSKGLFQWKIKGYYGYSNKTGKFGKRRK